MCLLFFWLVGQAGVTIPSQRRYVHYYAEKLARGSLQLKTLKMLSVKFVTIPLFDKLTGGCDPFFKVGTALLSFSRCLSLCVQGMWECRKLPRCTREKRCSTWSSVRLREGRPHRVRGSVCVTAGLH